MGDIKHDDTKHDDTDLVECAICLENLWIPVQLDGCKHIFCESCIRSCKNKCPLCRQKWNHIKKLVWDDVCPQNWKTVHTKCPKCESNMTIHESYKHSCCVWSIDVIDKKLKCPNCQRALSWFTQTCNKCNLRGERVDHSVLCVAEILFWNNGEPHVMLDEFFCPNWGSGWTCSLRIWVLHKDGSMSHFAEIEHFFTGNNASADIVEVWKMPSRPTITDKSPFLRWKLSD